MQIVPLVTLLLLAYTTTASQAAPTKTYNAKKIESDNAFGSHHRLGLNSTRSQINAPILNTDLLRGKKLVEISSGSKKKKRKISRMPPEENDFGTSSIECDGVIFKCTQPNNQSSSRYTAKTHPQKTANIITNKKPALTKIWKAVNPSAFSGNASTAPVNTTIKNNSPTHPNDDTSTTQLPQNLTTVSTSTTDVIEAATSYSTPNVTTQTPQISKVTPPPTTPLISDGDENTSTESKSTTPPTDRTSTHYNESSTTNFEVAIDPNTLNVTIETASSTVPPDSIKSSFIVTGAVGAVLLLGCTFVIRSANRTHDKNPADDRHEICEPLVMKPTNATGAQSTLPVGQVKSVCLSV